MQDDLEDIPVLQRESAATTFESPKPHGKLTWLALVAGVALIAGLGWLVIPRSATGKSSAVVVKQVTDSKQPLLGHRRYAEAPRSDLTMVSKYRNTGRGVWLRKQAATQYERMRLAARAEGVGLIGISGFRDESYQEKLFTRQLGKQGTASTATRVNAPPGYSEHHTGYAIDIGDASNSGSDAQLIFERTPAFRWLVRHAGRYGYEMSFPKQTSQSVSYEPWHWRFVGNREALETFY
ncbi:MAG: D-alanyl-D-alanine carboxypeptidase family protein [Gemmatimonadaceae bacterium]|nr:D-alanyl-D-alanine carboxypeptidase family protein [Gloeobacterales cyanobacterium ES-bin-141]